MMKSKIFCSFGVVVVLVSVDLDSGMRSALASEVDIYSKQVKSNLVEQSGYRISQSSLSEYPSIRRLEYPRDGVSLGQSWNSITDRKLNSTCITFQRDEMGGQASQVTTRKITESDSLRKELEVSYSASAKASFGSGGGNSSIKSSFLKSTSIDRESIYLLVKGEIQNGVEFVSSNGTLNGEIELSDKARHLVEKGKFDDFINMCGDSYISAIERGASLYALYKFSATEVRSKDENKTLLEGAGNFGSFSGSASKSTRRAVESIKGKKLEAITYTHLAHRGLRLPYDEASISSSLASLGSSLELKDAHPYKIVLSRYDDLPLWANYKKIKTGPATREALVALYIRLKDIQQAVEKIEEEPSKFHLDYSQDIASFAALSSLLRVRLQELENALTKCEDLAQQNQEKTFKLTDYLNYCITRGSDLAFTDYPIRALMPIERTQIQPIYTNVKENEVKTKIAVLEKLYKNKKVRHNVVLPGGGLDHALKKISINAKCPKYPQNKECRNIRSQIDNLNKMLSKFLSEKEVYNLAESRYRIWIKEAEKEREETHQMVGKLSSSELDLYRRDIYCQYGISPDEQECPSFLLSEQILYGYPMPDKIEEDVQLEGEPGIDPQIGFENLKVVLRKKLTELSEGLPYYYELVNPKYEDAEIDGKTTFKVVTKISMTRFKEKSANELF